MKINKKIILPNGSIEGKTFSGSHYKRSYPHPQSGEIYSSYKTRVDECKKQGFHLGDLTWNDWYIYCRAGGNPDGIIR